MVPHVVLICISAVIHDVGRIFHVLTDRLCIFLGELSMQIPLCIFKLGYSFCSLPCSPTSSSLGGHDRKCEMTRTLVLAGLNIELCILTHLQGEDHLDWTP